MCIQYIYTFNQLDLGFIFNNFWFRKREFCYKYDTLHTYQVCQSFIGESLKEDTQVVLKEFVWFLI
jgi:hypothetical protein